MHGVVSFLIARDTDAALRFYRDTLSLTFLRDDEFALVFDLDGVMLRISIIPDFEPAQHTVLGWRSNDLAADVDRLTAKGVSFNRYEHLEQDERAICTFPNGDKVAWFEDPSGNVLSISQHAQV
jgi:catechol 2,3-dioxygenase-like lactoylglutathione lyase family enzyme